MPLRRTGTPVSLTHTNKQPGPRLCSAPLRKSYALRCVRGTAHTSTVLPLLMTVALRAFTLASNEITLPSFHISMVTVSPG